MKKLLVLLLLLIGKDILSQNLPKPFDINSKETVVDYMNDSYATYCKKGPTYENAVVPFNEQGSYAAHKYLVINKEDIRDGYLITIKMSENSLFVFLIFNLYENKSYTGKTICCYAPIKFGELDKNSFKKLIITKKRLLIDNTYREELTIGSMKFTIENKTDFKKVLIGNTETKLNNYDFFNDASFKGQDLGK